MLQFAKQQKKIALLENRENTVLKLCISVGIDIPDYISSRGKSDSIRPVIDKMRELGKRAKPPLLMGHTFIDTN